MHFQHCSSAELREDLFRNQPESEFARKIREMEEEDSREALNVTPDCDGAFNWACPVSWGEVKGLRTMLMKAVEVNPWGTQVNLRIFMQLVGSNLPSLRSGRKGGKGVSVR